MKVILIIASLYFCKSSFGWGKIGHRVVGAIAARELNTQTSLKVNSILNGKTLEMIANYPDFLRSDPKFRKYNPYHYINDDLIHKASKEPNILNGIREFKKILLNKDSSKKEKEFALSFLVHLIGDIHQPLHVGKKKDRGGNKVDLKWFGKPTNLHSVWDEHLIQMQELSYTEYVEFLYKTPDLSTLKVQLKTPNEWAEESKNYVPETYKNLKGKYWEYSYNFKHRAKLNERLFVAGKRLALFLNESLK